MNESPNELRQAIENIQSVMKDGYVIKGMTLGDSLVDQEIDAILLVLAKALPPANTIGDTLYHTKVMKILNNSMEQL